MTLTIRVLGLELFALDYSTDPPDEDDTQRDLSGGNTTSDRVEAGPTDRYMGFTNGRGDDE